MSAAAHGEDLHRGGGHDEAQPQSAAGAADGARGARRLRWTHRTTRPCRCRPRARTSRTPARLSRPPGTPTTTTPAWSGTTPPASPRSPRSRCRTRLLGTDFPHQSGHRLRRAVEFLEEALPPEQAEDVLTAGTRLIRRREA